jgi:RHS repeat-associated protein
MAPVTTLRHHQGNVARVNDAGSTDMRFSYNSWGQVNSIIPSYGWGSSFTCHTYNGRWGYNRDNNGLYYCQHRYYDLANGRWVTRDPVRYIGGTNIYAYCANRPIVIADESGLLLGAPAEAGCVGASEVIGGTASTTVAVGAGVVTGGVLIGVGLGAGIGTGLDKLAGGKWCHFWCEVLHVRCDSPSEIPGTPQRGPCSPVNSAKDWLDIVNEHRADFPTNRDSEEACDDAFLTCERRVSIIKKRGIISGGGAARLRVACQDSYSVCATKVR